MIGFIVALAVAMLASAVGFKQYIWFISIGYGFAIAAIGAALLIMFHGRMDAAQWIACILGYLGIIYVMFSGARRLEIRQNRVYGNDPEYVNYARTVPIMIPLIPLYSVEKHKWLVA